MASAAPSGGGGAQGSGAASGASTAGAGRPSGELKPEQRLGAEQEIQAHEPTPGTEPVAQSAQRAVKRASRKKSQGPAVPQTETQRETSDPANIVAKINEAERGQIVPPSIDADLARQLAVLAKQRQAQFKKVEAELDSAREMEQRAKEQSAQRATKLDAEERKKSGGPVPSERPEDPAKSPDWLRTANIAVGAANVALGAATLASGGSFTPAHVALGTLSGGLMVADLGRGKPKELEPLPAELASRYIRDGERVYDRGDLAKIAFIDRGEAMKTTNSDLETARAIVSLAESRGWDAIKTSGTKAFRQAVYVEASARGIKVSGYSPTREDNLAIRVRAEKLLERNAATRVDPREAEAAARAVAIVNEDLRRKAEAAPNKEQADRVSHQLMERLQTNLESGLARGDRPRELRVRVPQGVFVEAGAAKYLFNPKENDSYYVRYIDDHTGQTRERWGKGLQQALADAKVQPGDRIRLQQVGAKPVQVQANIRNQQNEIVGQQRITAQRADWKIEVVERKFEKERIAPARSAPSR